MAHGSGFGWVRVGLRRVGNKLDSWVRPYSHGGVSGYVGRSLRMARGELAADSASLVDGQSEGMTGGPRLTAVSE
jgi:hypothetical protein